MKNYYAHSKDGEPPENWQPLETHLKNVAEMAKDWAYLAGLWHDLGKGDKWIFMLMETRVRS